MTPTRDTDTGWTDQTTPPRSKRESAGTVARKAVFAMIGKLVPYVTALVMAYLVAWTARIDGRADDAKDKATGTAVETAVTYDETKTKLDDSGETIEKLVAEVNALREEVERLKAAKATRPGRVVRPRPPPPIKVPASVTEPLPASPAAAVQERGLAP